MIRWSDVRRSSIRFIFEFTDDPTIIFLIIFTDDPTIIWKIFTDDPTITFLIIFTDDPTIIWNIFTDDPTIMNMVFLAKSYRRSDDHDMDFLAKVTDDPTITVSNLVPNSCQNWNPVPNEPVLKSTSQSSEEPLQTESEVSGSTSSSSSFDERSREEIAPKVEGERPYRFENK